MDFMLDAELLKRGMEAISQAMDKNYDYLTELDSQNGDGDLGVSMANGYKAVVMCLADNQEKDLGRLLMQCAKAFNEASPSSLGTITSFGMMGMAKSLKGKQTANLSELANAMKKGLELIMEKAGSRPGEKTILDALYPAVDVLLNAENTEEMNVLKKAAEAAANGSESTRQMRSVHGRAAYYGDGSLGMLDGGSVVGRIIFETLAEIHH